MMRETGAAVELVSVSVSAPDDEESTFAEHIVAAQLSAEDSTRSMLDVARTRVVLFAGTVTA